METWKTVLVTAALAVLLVADPSVMAGLRAACGCPGSHGRSCSGGVCCVESGRPRESRTHGMHRAASGPEHGSTPEAPAAHVCGCTLRSGAPDASSTTGTRRTLQPRLLTDPIAAPAPAALADACLPDAPALPASFVPTPEAPPPRLAV